MNTYVHTMHILKRRHDTISGKYAIQDIAYQHTLQLSLNYTRRYASALLSRFYTRRSAHLGKSALLDTGLRSFLIDVSSDRSAIIAAAAIAALFGRAPIDAAAAAYHYAGRRFCIKLRA